MLDLFLNWFVIAIPFLVSVVATIIALKLPHERHYWKFVVGACVLGFIFSGFTYWQQVRTVNAAAADRKAAIEETTRRVARETTENVTNALGAQYSRIMESVTQQAIRLTAQQTELQRQAALTAKNLEYITGGDEYCWAVPFPPLPVEMGGNPQFQGKEWQQIALRNSGSVMLPSCDISFFPFPTEEELKTHNMPDLKPIFYHFEKVPANETRYTQYYIRGDRIYSGVIETPTHQFIEVLKFEPDPKSFSGVAPVCRVTAPSGKTLEDKCYPQKATTLAKPPPRRKRKEAN